MKLGRSGGIPDQITFNMTPMIDCTFQLVIFFMLTLNFANDEQNEMIRLPASELAKPADAPLEWPITLQLTDRGTVIVGGDEVPVTELAKILQREKSAMVERGKSVSKANVIIRADRSAKAGLVQQMIEISQKMGLEKFVLRAKEEEGAK